ncbi:MAG: methyltransferase domain-containing protein [Beijerinckiaceae bacterium]
MPCTSSLPVSDAAPRDPLADRRFAYAAAAAEDGAWQEAAELFEQAIERAPAWTAAWIGLGDARAAGGDRAQALEAYRQALTLDPADLHGAALKIATLDSATLPSQAPPAYVSALFDEYAPRFEAHLTGKLGYCGPADLAGALAELGRTRFAHAIDLGCGTGLGGVAFRPMVSKLTGVDLSPKMIEAAEAKGIYERLETKDILAFLQDEPTESAGLILAADVFIYLGDLAPVLFEAARVLPKDGTLAFTAQRCSTGIEVGPDLRFAHSSTLISDVLTRCGFRILMLREHSARREKGSDVPGLLAVAARA